jgi:hypothetical protein
MSKAARDQRQAKRAQNRSDRREFKLAKISARQNARTERVALRTDAKKVAYENGIAPGAMTAQAIAGGLSSVAQVGVAALTGGGTLAASLSQLPFSEPQTSGFSAQGSIGLGLGSSDLSPVFPGDPEGNSKGKILMILAALVAFMLLIKKR